MFREWNKGELDSFLIEITTDIMAFKDTDGQPLVEKIKDAAGQKGTGKWTAISALDKGMPVTLIGKSNYRVQRLVVCGNVFHFLPPSP